MASGRVGLQSSDGRLGVPAEEDGAGARCDLPLKEVGVDVPRAQPDGRQVVPAQGNQKILDMLFL